MRLTRRRLENHAGGLDEQSDTRTRTSKTKEEMADGDAEDKADVSFCRPQWKLVSVTIG